MHLLKFPPFAATCLVLVWTATTLAAVNFVPPGNKIMISVWSDNYPYKGPYNDDSPLKIDTRTGKHWPVYHMAQNIPVIGADMSPANIDTTIDYSLIEALGTDAILILDLYPYALTAGHAYSNIQDSDIQALASQCAGYNAKGRRVILRIFAEMNGNWYPWAQQPIEFVAMYRKIALAVRAVAPLVSFPLSPGTTGATSAANFAAMDTNGDGQISFADNPYTPYFPGTDVVDWVGTSMYYWGPYDSTGNYGVNAAVDPNYFVGWMTGAGGAFNFYSYVVSLGKPITLAEWGIPYYVTVDPGVGELAMKRAWWSQSLTNAATMAMFPNVKMFGLFEWRKYEPGLRDFQFLNTSTNGGIVTSTFLSDLATTTVEYVWANSTIVASATAAAAASPTAATSVTPKASTGIKIELCSFLAVAAVAMTLITAT
ncbi:hypothetical protein SmJEL517_g01430 [Synchytrium microbalum]|uniref:GH26 domain-containing protein n=1 Tax=Synchytrium microbalum TaxID=1806994 RepID=A0A507CF14_9FUNG|nr:uncharacterized protein SmJEL517_g01430 [Synchytrium microbalum]TPX36175.1 hypothetical protein SmJEL517_g01430 [Synchytrium microbalum]